MSFKPRQFRAGEVISARALNEFFAEVARLGKIGVVAPMTMADDSAGIHFGVALQERWAIKLTGAGPGGDYNWTRQIGATGGGWADHPGGQTGTTGADPAHEMNANATVDLSPNPVVEAWRDPVSGALLFQQGSC